MNIHVFRRKTFNDTLALLLLGGIPGLWVLHHWLSFPGEIIGASIAVWTLVANFYFRKASSSSSEPTIPTTVNR